MAHDCLIYLLAFSVISRRILGRSPYFLTLRYNFCYSLVVEMASAFLYWPHVATGDDMKKWHMEEIVLSTGNFNDKLELPQ